MPAFNQLRERLRESPGHGRGWTESLGTRAGQYHTHLFDLALFTDQLLAQNQKGQVGVLGMGEVRGEGIMHSCSRKGKREEAGRNEAARGPGQAGAGSPQLWWWALLLITLCSR